MTSLRTMEGTDIDYAKELFGKYADELLINAQVLINKGWVKNIPGKLILTREGKLFADAIASELFSEA